MPLRLTFATLCSLGLCACGADTPSAPAAEIEAATPLPAGGWQLVHDQSNLTFEASHNGNPVIGRFESFDAAIILDPETLSAASIDVTVDLASVTTGDRQYDNALPGTDWFHVKEYPTAQFTSSDIQDTDDDTYVANGTLIIRDVSHPLSLPFSLSIDGDMATASGAVTLLRTEIGLANGQFSDDEWVGFEVKVGFDVTAMR